MRRFLYIAVLAGMISIPGATLASQPGLDYRISGEASGWARGYVSGGERYGDTGVRYIPSLTAAKETGAGRTLDLYLSVDAFAAYSGGGDSDDYDLDLYRLSLRHATGSTETRIGLQKISFGPAVVLRSLMWFDSLDPRDPQQLTSGVWAIRFRYDALDNSSLWLWGILPDGERKGLEFFPSDEGYPEFGGRYVRSVPAGEMALSLNTRRAVLPGRGIVFRENRFALDGKWDVKVGLWAEAVVQHQDFEYLPLPWTRMLTIGTDYTFGIGNGLYAMVEQMGIYMSADFWSTGEDYQTTAWMANYPVGLIDNLSAIGFYSWDSREYYQYISWRRTWDNWVLDISLFHYPETEAIIGSPLARQAALGDGAQLIVIFNH